MSNLESRMTNLEKRVELLSNGQFNRQNHQTPLEPLMETREPPKPVQIQPQSIQSIFDSGKRAQKLEPASESSSVSLFNAANFLVGASVDSSRSSSSNLSPFLTWDQTGLVLLDRPEPPVDKAYCTSEKNPVLTVNLAKYVKPISVSYQHSKWYGIIPSGAPKRYSVWACLDYYCEDMQPLVSNCEYKVTSDNQQEQMFP
ncbi:hypothetical protein CAEBREN_05069 [Caenorhabditis brenneri]|uniref:SUN domain-containing protein n=1 Tax=Caenorhabditis brenneri TaxID=135651 RepID=G0PBS1_CAEBE|nr:hypothetical protein CAEBREN_05069 [Caenorhabditis brenneri]